MSWEDPSPQYLQIVNTQINMRDIADWSEPKLVVHLQYH